MIKKLIGLALVCVALMNCKQVPPEEGIIDPGPTGDFSFSGYNWRYKTSTNPVGPGPNIFKADSSNVWMDANGLLHLTIRNVNGQWQCSEVISTRVFGYGTYEFTLASDVADLDHKVVVGLFTWDTYSFQTQANSEVDIEFSKWNDPAAPSTLSYAVQPVVFSNPTPFSERTFKPTINPMDVASTSTHQFRWAPDEVIWTSFTGEGSSKIEMANWNFDSTNISRTKIEGPNTSDPIVIPAPSDSTNVRFNLWLLGGNAPTDSEEVEVVIKSFRFTPL